MFLWMATAFSASIDDVFTVQKTSLYNAKESKMYLSKVEITKNIQLSKKGDNIIIEFNVKNKTAQDVTISQSDAKCFSVIVFKDKTLKGAPVIPSYGTPQPLLLSGKFPVILKPGELTAFCAIVNVVQFDQFIIYISFFKEFWESIEFKRKTGILSETEVDSD